jgi:hypothetical protein
VTDGYRPADLTLDRIGDLATMDLGALVDSHPTG